MNSPEKEGYEYGYTMFVQLPDIYAESGKHKLVLSMDISNVDATDDTVMTKESNKATEILLPLRNAELLDGQNNQSFCGTISKSFNGKKIPPDKYFISNNRLYIKM